MTSGNATAGSRTHQAHVAIRAWLRDGECQPGRAIIVKDVAVRLKLSVTPVREALERLVGEGLVAESRDRRGFVCPFMGTRDYTELVELHAILVEGALARVRTPDWVENVVLPPDARGAAEALFSALLSTAGEGCRNLWERVADRLAPYRLIEPDVFGTDTSEIDSLKEALAVGKGKPAVRAYHRRRTLNAMQIVQARESRRSASSEPPSKNT